MSGGPVYNGLYRNQNQLILVALWNSGIVKAKKKEHQDSVFENKFVENELTETDQKMLQNNDIQIVLLQ